MIQRMKGTAQAHAVNQRDQQVGCRPQPHKPGVMQPQTAMASRMNRQPVAPPVHRSQPSPGTVQAKTAHPSQPHRKPPVAPPAYRPQAVPKVLQTKQHISSPPSSSRPTPTCAAAKAPPVYNPNNSPRIVQPYIPAGGGRAVTPQRPAAPLSPRRPPVPQVKPATSNSVQRQAAASPQRPRVSPQTPPAASVIQPYTLIRTKRFRGKRSENGRYVTGENLSEIYVFPGNAVANSYRTNEVATILGVDYEVWKPNFNVIEDCVACMEEILHGKKLKYGAPSVSEYRDPVGNSKKRKAFGDSDSENRKRGKLTDLEEDANPGISEGYVIARQGYARDEERPQFHGAGVVAQDGHDDITLEATAPELGPIGRNRVQPVYDMYQRGKKGRKSFKFTYQAEYGKDATVSVIRPVKKLPKNVLAPLNSNKIIDF